MGAIVYSIILPVLIVVAVVKHSQNLFEERAEEEFWALYKSIIVQMFLQLFRKMKNYSIIEGEELEVTRKIHGLLDIVD